MKEPIFDKSPVVMSMVLSRAENLAGSALHKFRQEFWASGTFVIVCLIYINNVTVYSIGRVLPIIPVLEE